MLFTNRTIGLKPTTIKEGGFAAPKIQRHGQYLPITMACLLLFENHIVTNVDRGETTQQPDSQPSEYAPEQGSMPAHNFTDGICVTFFGESKHCSNGRQGSRWPTI